MNGYCSRCGCFDENEDCPCECHDVILLRCMGQKAGGAQCTNVATKVYDDRWFCAECDPGEKSSGPGPEWDEFIR